MQMLQKLCQLSLHRVVKTLQLRITQSENEMVTAVLEE